MCEIPYTNTKDHVVHIGTKAVRPGETRMVDESMLPDAHKRGGEAPPEPEQTLIDRPVKEIAEALPNLSDAELDELLAAEEAGKTRKSLLEAIARERLRRAEAQTEDQDPTSDEEE